MQDQDQVGKNVDADRERANQSTPSSIPMNRSRSDADRAAIRQAGAEESPDASELQGTGKFFSDFMKNLPGLAWIKDLDGCYVYANDEALRAFGCTPDELYGRHDEDVFPPDTAVAFRENDERAMARNSGIRTIETLDHADGTRHQSVVAKFPIIDDGGKLAFVGGMAFDITERRQIEVALESAQRHLEIVADSMAVSVTRCSRDLKYLWVNRHYADWFGCDSHDIVGKSVAEVMGDRGFARVREYVERVLSGNVVTFDEHVVLHSQGPRWVHAVYSPTFGKGGEPDGWVGVISDVTSERLAEKALHEHEARKSAILDTSLDAIISIDHEGTILEWNPAAARMFGLRREEAMGREMASLIVPRSLRDQHRAGLAQVLATGDGRLLGRRVELTALRCDGTEFPVEVAIARIPGEEPPQFTGFVHDITERKRAEQQLTSLNAQLERLVAERTENTNRLLEDAPDGIVVVNAEGRITQVNQQTEALFGFRENELLGQSVDMLLPPELHQRHRDHRAAYFENPRLRSMGSDLSLFGRHKDGRDIAVAIQLTPLALNGELLAVASIRDVSKQRQLEKQMAELIDAERQRLGRELHDTLGQECTAMGMLVAALKSQCKDLPDQLRILDQLEGSVETSKQQLRLLAKGLFPVDLDVQGLRVALEELAAETSRSQGVNCHFDCPAPIPVQDNFIATQLYLLAREAVQDAVNHSEASKIVIELTHDNGVCLCVRDDGQSRQAERDRLADVALRIMRHRATLIGGNLQVDAGASRGTAVTCWLREPGLLEMTISDSPVPEDPI